MTTTPLFACATLMLLAVAHGNGVCDPLNPELCSLPFPNDFWRNASTGLLHLHPDTFPHTANGRGIDADGGGWNDLDGFSTHGSINAYFPSLDIDNLPPFWDMQRSLHDDCPTLLLDAATGERVPHFAELDHVSDDTHGGPDADFERMLMLWPATKLKHGTRYVVALRGLVHRSGETVTASPAFAALRDRVPSNDPDVERRRQHFEDIFGIVADAGVERSQLQLAWDFTTNTRSAVTGRLVHMRDDSFDRMPARGPEYEITSVEYPDDERVAKRLIVSMQVPYYTTTTRPGATLVLDEDGMPVFQGFTDVETRVDIPESAWRVGQHSPVMQYGHGLFGSYNEVGSSYLRDIAQEHSYITVATTWIGLADEDVPRIVLMMTQDLSDFAMVPDRCSQGVVNALWAMKLLKMSLSRDAELMLEGESVVDVERTYFYGNSQGGIIGTVYAAVTTDVTRHCLGVGGGPYGLLLPRSNDFDELLLLINVRYRDPLSRAMLFNVFQLLWDRAEPTGYVESVMLDPLPGTPKHEMLLQYGLHDTQVNYIGAEMMARGIGAHMFESNVHEPDEMWFGFDVASDDDVVRGALVQGWDFAQPKPSPFNRPPRTGLDTHEWPRREHQAIAQMAHFFDTGDIVNMCQGPCVNPDKPRE